MSLFEILLTPLFCGGIMVAIIKMMNQQPITPPFGLSVGMGISITVVTTMFATLAHVSLVQRGSSFMIGFSAPEQVFRGWPLNWYGIRFLGIILTPAFFMVDALFWTLVASLWYFLIGKTVYVFALARWGWLAFVCGWVILMVCAYLLPFYVPTIL